MKSKFAPLALSVGIAILLSFLPIYPLWTEGRQFAESGESLYHELQFVSIHEYYGYAQYAQTAWLQATKFVYVLLAIVNPLILLFLSWRSVSVLRKWTTR